MTAKTLKDAVMEAFAEKPNSQIYHFLDDHLDVARSLSYADLVEFAARLRTRLNDMPTPPDRVCLSVTDNAKFISLFFACVLNDITIVPAHPPMFGRKSRRLEGIIQDSGLRTLITDEASLPLYEGKGLDFGEILTYEEVQREPPSPLDESSPGEDDLLVIQYTSGSTSHPKGVMLTHRNVITNSWIIAHAFNSVDGHIGDVVGLTWLPVYHDMGLIGNVIQASVIAKPLYVMDTLAFIRNPMSWLEAIDRFDVRISGGPNFAYRAVARRLVSCPDLNLDLSSWRLAYCGAEPIDPANLSDFATALASQGFRPEAFTPCYGLAESTLMVTAEAADSRIQTIRRKVGDDEALAAYKNYVSCGRATGDTRILIVDEQDNVMPEDTVGEILVAGKSVMPGYLNHGEEDFFVNLKGRDYFRTGDVGFLLDEALYVVGRVKDCLIINGGNIYAVDVEGTLGEEIAGLAGKVMAVHQDDDGVRLHIEAPGEELEMLRAADMKEAIRNSVYKNFGFVFEEVLLYPEFCLPRTTSGKIRRPKCLKMRNMAYVD